MTLAMDMDARKAELLLRSALLDDASNIGERLAALGADIRVEDDGDAWITLDMDLWPEDKDSPQAEAIAKMLWLEVDWSSTAGTFPFAWPGLGEHSDKTTTYFKRVLDAYGDQKPGYEIQRFGPKLPFRTLTDAASQNHISRHWVSCCTLRCSHVEADVGFVSWLCTAPRYT